MPEGKRTFKVGERIADIPAEKIDGFMQTHPDAIEVKSFIVDKDTADIPLDKVDGFLKAYPNAKPLYSDNTMGKSKPEGGSSPSSGGELQLPKINLQTAEQFKKPIEFGSKTLNEQLADPRFRDIAKLTKIVEETNKKEGALGLQNLYQKLDKETIDAAKYILGDNVSFYKEKLNESFSDAQFNMQQLNTKKQNIQAYKEQENTAKKLISDYQQTGDPTQIKQALVQVGMNPEYVENNWEEAARIYIQEELPARFNREVDGYNQALKALDISQQSVDRFEKDLLTSINDKLLKSAEGAKALFIGNPDFYISKIVTPERLAQARNTDEKQQQEAKLQSSFDNFVNNFSGAFSSFSKFVDGLNTQISSTVLGDIEGGQGEIDAMRNALKEAKIYWDNVMDLEMPNTDEERMKADYFGSMNPNDWNWYKIMGDIGMTTGSMSAIIGAGVVGGPAAAMTTGGAMVYGDVYSSALEAGMDSRNATLFALGVSTVAGGLEAAGSIPILKTLTGEAGKKIVKGFIRDGALLKAAPKEILYKSGKLALNAAGNTIKEIGTEVAQTALESGSKMIINEAEAGVNFKDAPQTISELGEDLLSTAKSTAVGMTPISLVGGVSSYRTATREIERATMTNTIKMLRNDSEYMNRAATNLDGLVERGKMTAQDAEKEKALLERVNQIQQAYPEVTDFNDIGEITRLEIRKDGLKAQDLKREESGFKPLNESAIKEIDDAQDEILKKYKDKLAESAKTEVAPEVATETQRNTVTDEKGNEEVAQSAEITDKEYNDFIDNGVVTEKRISSIAEKVKANEPLSERETEIFSDKTAEINKKIAETVEQSTPMPEGVKVEGAKTQTDEKLRNEEAERREKGRQESLLEPENVGGEQAPSVSESLSSGGIFVKDGKSGSIRLDGQTVVFETKDEIIELGNKNEVENASISEFNIEKELPLNIEVNNDNTVSVDGKKYVNNFSNPQAAINRDLDGNVVSVNLETENGQKRTFRGQKAEEIAYQYTLKEFEQNATDETIGKLEEEVTRLEEAAAKPATEAKKRSVTKRNEAKPKAVEQSLQSTPQAGVVGGEKIKLDPDLAKIDPTLIAARNGDLEAQRQFEEMGLDWKQTTTYRFVGQSEVDVLLANEKVESRRGMADIGIDVTSSPKVTTAATGEYRVTFKESFDKNNGLGKVRKKNEEDGNLERGRGYDINDVAKIERIDEKGNVVETIYDQSQAVNAAGGENPALKDVESTAKALEGLSKKKKTAATETGTKVVGDKIVEGTDVNSETLGISQKISQGFTKAGEQSKIDKSPKALGEWLINNAQTGDRIIVDEDTYWVVERKTDKKGNTEIELQQYFKNENDVFENNPSAVKLFNSKHIGTETAKLATRDASDLFESSYRNSNGDVVVQQSKYIPASKDSKSISEAYHKAKADGSNPELVKAVEELLTPKIEQDAKEQQSGQMREQSVQETTKRSGDSDMPKVNETKLSDGKKTSKEQKLNESKENFKKALKKWTDINKESGISPNVRKKAQADIDLFNSAIQLVKDYAEYGVEKLSEIIKEATKDIFDGKITQRQKDIISDAFEFVKSGKKPDRYVPENAYLRAMQDAYKQGVEATEAEFKQKMGDLKSDFKEFMQFVAEQNKEETKSKLDSKSAKFKAFREGQKAFAKVFNDTLKSAQEKNFITPFEYRMLARRASLAQTEGQWNKLMDLTNRVLSDASYRSKLAEAERLQKQAKQKKHGQATEEVKRFTRISPEDIDINKLDEYIAALGDLTLPIPKYGKMQAIVFEIEDNFRRSNPDLFTGRTDSSISGSEKVNKAFEKASEAFDNVMESLNKDAITVDDYRYAVKQAGIAIRNLDLVIADMRTMYEDDKLTPEALEEAENMYLDVLDSIGTSVADLSAKFPSQIDQLVTELVNQINDNLPKIDKSTLTNSEKDMLKKLELYNSADLKKLSPIELDFYNQLIENFLNEGYFDMQRFKAVQSALFAATNKDKTVKFVNDIKQVFDDRFDNMPPANRLAAQVSATWQGALTGFGKLFAGAFDVGFISPIMTSLKKADEETRKIVRELRDLQRKHGIQESAIFGKESYRERAHRIGMVAAYLREYGLVLSGEPRKVDKKEGGQMEGERDVFRRLSDEKGTVVATGEKSEKSKDPKGEYDYGSKTEDKKLDQKIYKSFPKSKTVVDNGVEYKEVDPKEVYDSIFTEPNNKFLNAKERAFLIDYYKLLEKTRDLQQAANAMRGLPFKPVTLYSPRQRYSTRKTSGLVPFPILKGGRISLRGSSGKEVVTEELSAMNNNTFDVFLQYAEETMRDYYVTSAVMDVNSLYKSVMPEIENDNGKYVKAMMDKISDSLNDHYIFPPKDIVQRGLSALNRIGTFRIFVNIARTAYEIISFSTFGVLRMGTGLKSYRNFGEAVKIRSQVTSLMNDVNSMFTGSMISKDIEFKEGRIEAEKFNTYFTRMFASAAESIFKRMLWYTRFQQEFKQKTGQKFDIDKYESSLDYRKKYREAIEEAKVQSDKSFELITGSPVRAGRRKKVRLLPIAGTRAVVDIDGVWGQALSLFTAYPFRGAIQAVDGLTDLKNEPSLKRANDAKNAILGTLGEQLAYGFATTAGGLALALTFTPDDDEEEKERIRKEIDELFTLNELGLETLASAVGMLSASANGAGRIFVKAVGTLAYSASEDKEQKEMIVKFMQKVQYGKLTDYSKIKNDLKLKQAIYIDLIESSGFLGLTELARVTVDSYNAYKDYEELMDLYENGTPEQKEKAKDAIILAYLFVKAVNIIGALGAFKGAAFNINSKSLNQLANQQMDDIIPSRALENENRSIVDTKRTKKEVLEAMQVGYLKDADESTLLDDLKKLGREKKILIEQYDYTGEEFLTAIKKQVTDMLAKNLDSGGQNIEKLTKYNSEQQLDTDKAFDAMFLFANRGDKKEKALRIALLKTMLKLPKTQEDRLKQKVEGGYDNSYYNSILKNDAQTIFEFIKFMKKQNKL